MECGNLLAHSRLVAFHQSGSNSLCLGMSCYRRSKLDQFPQVVPICD